MQSTASKSPTIYRGRRDNKEAPAGEGKQFDLAQFDSGIVCLAANN